MREEIHARRTRTPLRVRVLLVLAVACGERCYACVPALRRRTTNTAPAPRATATPPVRPIIGSAELEPVSARLPVASTSFTSLIGFMPPVCGLASPGFPEAEP